MPGLDVPGDSGDSSPLPAPGGLSWEKPHSTEGAEMYLPGVGGDAMDGFEQGYFPCPPGSALGRRKPWTLKVTPRYPSGSQV